MVQQIETRLDLPAVRLCSAQPFADAFEQFPPLLFPTRLAPHEVLIGQGFDILRQPEVTDKLSGVHMIWLTRLNSAPVVVNSDLIEHIDITPDTVIAMTTGQVFRVQESAEAVIARVMEFRRQIAGPAPVEEKTGPPSEI